MGEVAGLAAIISAVVGWLLRTLIGREVARMDKALEGHDSRLRIVEQTTEQAKGMLAGLQDNVSNLRMENSEYHRERMEEIRRVHGRLDELLGRPR